MATQRPTAFIIMMLYFLSSQIVEARDLWLVYKQENENSLQYDYKGCFEAQLPTSKEPVKSSIREQANNLLKSSNNPLLSELEYTKEKKGIPCGADPPYKKPTVTKNDHVYVLVESSNPLICTRNEESFKPVDAPVVPRTNGESFVAEDDQKKPVFMCDLATKDKGNTKITYTISVISRSNEQSTIVQLEQDTKVKLPATTKVMYGNDEVTLKEETEVKLGAKTSVILPANVKMNANGGLKLAIATKATFIMFQGQPVTTILLKNAKAVKGDQEVQLKKDTRVTLSKSRQVTLPPTTQITPQTSTTVIFASAGEEESAMDYNVADPQKGPAKKEPEPTKPPSDSNPNAQKVIESEVLVHELYRFRIVSGPVFSSIAVKNKTFSTITNAGGQQVISSSRNNDAPIGLPVFLKTYLHPDGRDILENPGFDCDGLLKRTGVLVGLNLVDSPLKNFYVGASFELYRGIDLVGGAHFAKTNKLAGGFSDGQPISSSSPPQNEKFLTGGFVGITADVGVIGSWLGSQITKSIKDGFK